MTLFGKWKKKKDLLEKEKPPHWKLFTPSPEAR
jgi:hypothetical protein